jgi:hypothetical protein
MSKHGGGRSYNVILEFKGANKKIDEKEKEKNDEKTKKI